LPEYRICELVSGEDVGPLFETGVTFYGKEKLVRLRFEAMRCKMMHDVTQKLTHFLFIKGLIKVIL